MGKRGTYKYICEDCQAENWLSARERDSRFKPKCIECGSTWLQASARSRGPKQIIKAQGVAQEFIKRMNKKMEKE